MYDRFVKQAPPNSLEGITQRLDFIGPKMIEMAERVKKMDVTVPDVKEVELIPFARTLLVAGVSGSGIVLTEKAPFDGHIKEITIHWPDGCDALVDIMVGRGVTQFCPREGYLALNDVTEDYEFNIPVKQGEDIWVEMINTDGANPHNITVTVRLENN